MTENNLLEVLAPVGDMERLYAALDFGADAVYLGGTAFGMRAASASFDAELLKKACDEAHSRGKRVYLTCNTLPHNDEIVHLEQFVNDALAAGVDAMIANDIGVFSLIKKYAPDMEIHVSTQAGIVNYVTANEFYNMGAKRVVLARELSLEEIAEIRAKTPKDLEIECFVHGAMCISYSGRCLLSNYLTGRDSNQGACTHPCRWKYSVMEESRPGEYFPVYENERGTYIFNSKDLCMIEHIPELIDAGIDSLKIEGRMKTALYVATVARTYRKAIDDYKKDPKLYEQNMPWYKEQISNCTYRQFTTGFFFGKPDETTQIYDSNTYNKEYTYLGIVGEIKDGLCRIEQRNKFSVGETIEIMKPDGRNIEAEVLRILNEEGKEQESAPHSKQLLYVELSEIPDVYDILRRKEEESK